MVKVIKDFGTQDEFEKREREKVKVSDVGKSEYSRIASFLSKQPTPVINVNQTTPEQDELRENLLHRRRKERDSDYDGGYFKFLEGMSKERPDVKMTPEEAKESKYANMFYDLDKGAQLRIYKALVRRSNPASQEYDESSAKRLQEITALAPDKMKEELAGQEGPQKEDDTRSNIGKATDFLVGGIKRVLYENPRAGIEYMKLRNTLDKGQISPEVFMKRRDEIFENATIDPDESISTNVRKTAADGAEAIIDVVSLGVGGKLATQSAKLAKKMGTRKFFTSQIGKQVLKKAMKEGAIHGAVEGGAIGLVIPFQENEMPTASQVAQSGFFGSLIGGTLGGAIPAVAPVVGAGARKIGRGVDNVLPERFKRSRPDETPTIRTDEEPTMRIEEEEEEELFEILGIRDRSRYTPKELEELRSIAREFKAGLEIIEQGSAAKTARTTKAAKAAKAADETVDAVDASSAPTGRRARGAEAETPETPTAAKTAETETKTADIDVDTKKSVETDTDLEEPEFRFINAKLLEDAGDDGMAARTLYEAAQELVDEVGEGTKITPVQRDVKEFAGTPKRSSDKAALKKELREEEKLADSAFQEGVETQQKLEGEVADVRKQAITIVEETVPKNRQGKFIKSINNAKTTRDIRKIAERAEREARIDELAKLREDIRERFRKMDEKTKRKAREEEIKNIKDEIVQYAEKNLPLRERGKLLRKVKGAKTELDLTRALDQIDKLGEQARRRSVVNKIKKELSKKALRPTKSGDLKKGKFTADIQNKLQEVADAVDNPDPAKASQTLEDVIAAIENDGEITPELQFRLDFVNAHRLDNLSAEEAELLLKNIQDLKTKGRTEAQAKVEKLRKEREEFKEVVVSEITAGEKVAASDPLHDKEGVKAALSKLDNLLHGLDTLIDKMVSRGGKNQFESQTSYLVDRAHEARNQKTQGTREWVTKVTDKYQEIFGTGSKVRARQRQNAVIQTIGEFTDANGDKTTLNYSQNQMIDIYHKLQDPSLDKTFDAMAWTDEMKEAVVAAMDDDVYRWAQYLIDEFYPEYYESINKVYRERMGIDLPLNDRYTPVFRDIPDGKGKLKNSDIQSSGETLNSQAKSAFTSAKPGSLKERTNTTATLKFQDADSILIRHIMSMEHYKAFDEVIGDFRYIFNDPEVTRALKKEWGSHIVTTMNRLIDDMAIDGDARGITWSAIDKIRKNFTTSALGLNLSIVFKQLSSFPAYATEVPLKDMIKYSAEFAKSPKKYAKEIAEMSEWYRARADSGFERDVVDAVRTSTRKTLANQKNIRDKVMTPVKLGDRLPITPGFYVSYKSSLDKFIKQGYSAADAKEMAIRRAEQISKRTQQSGMTEDLSTIQRSGSWGRVFTMFMTAPTQYYRIASRSMRDIRLGRGNQAENVKNLVISWAVLPMIFQYVADGFRVDEERQARAAIMGPLNGIPMIGDLIDTIARKATGDDVFGDELLPAPLGVLQDMAGVLGDIGSYITGVEDFDEEDIMSVIESLIEETSELTGIPYKPVKRQIEGTIDTLQGGDPRRAAGFSDYALDEED